MADTSGVVYVQAAVPFREFIAPNFVTITDGENNIILPLEKLQPEALDLLVGVWLGRVYAKCNRKVPWDIPPPQAEGDQ
jgi:hypothetical protein